MRIGMILDNEFTDDLRVENEIIALREAGHDVFVLCLNHGDKKSREDFNGAEIIRIYLPLFLKNKLKGLNNTIINLYPLFWAKHIKKFIRENNIEILHVHDLWMLDGAYRGNEKFNLPVVADLHENFVHALNYYKYANTFPGNIIISKKRWEKSEIEWTQKADHVITVIEEAVARYNNMGIPRDKISVVANYVNSDNFLSYKIDPQVVSKLSGKFNILYVGGFDKHRGLETVIKAARKLANEINDFRIVLVGNGSNYHDLVSLADSLNVSDYVSFEGWQSHTKLPSYIKASDVCLIPHVKSVHTDNTIPHKLFHYMIFEKPVIASDCNPLKRIISETESGLVFESGNENDLYDKILKLYHDGELRKSMGEKGKKAVLSKYNWDVTKKELLKIYEKFEKGKKSGQ